MQQIQIVIDKHGNVQLEVSGAPGRSCLDLTKNMEEKLGGQVVQREYSREFYAAKEVAEEEKINRCAAFLPFALTNP
jgi:hypothetical protein